MPRNITITFRTENPNFEADFEGEINQVLRHAFARINNNGLGVHTLRDSTNQTVGTIVVTDKE